MSLLLSSFRLTDKEEKCEILQQQLHCKTKELHSIETLQTEHKRDESLRLANLNQALTHVKGTCAQLTEENDYLKDKERELLVKVETLQYENDCLLKKISEVALHEKELAPDQSKEAGVCVCTTPVKPIPEETKMDVLLHENAKLKQELHCLRTNFQLTSTKCSLIKKEMKELENALAEVQVQHDHVLGEKEKIEKETKTTEDITSGLVQTLREENEQLTKEVASLQDQLESVQSQNLKLQAKLRKELQHSLESQDAIESLDVRFKILTEEKVRSDNSLAQTQNKLQEVQEELLSLAAVQSQHSIIEQQSSDIVASYEQKMDSLKSENQNLKGRLAAAIKSLDDAHAKIQELEESENTLTRKVTSFKVKNETLSEQTKEYACLSSEIQLLRTKLVELAEQVEHENIQKTEIEEAKVKVDAKVKELSKSNMKLSQEATYNLELAEKLQKELEKMEAMSLEYKESCKEKENDRIKLAREIDNLKWMCSSTEKQKATYEAEVDTLMRKVEELEQCNFELGSKLSDIESESNSATISKTEYQAKIVELERKLQLLEGTLIERLSTISDLKCASEFMESENATLVSQVTSLSEMVAARNCKIDALNSQLSTYESDARDIVEKVTELEASHSQCTKIKAKLEEKVFNLKESLEAVRIADKESENAILTLKLKIMKLQESNSALQDIITHIEEEQKSKTKQSEELTARNIELESCMYTMKQELDVRYASMRSACEEIEFLKKSKTSMESSLKADIDTRDEKCKQLIAQHDTTEQRGKEFALRVTELETELQEEKHKTSAILSEKDSTSEQLSCIQAELNMTKDKLIMVTAELRSTKSALTYNEQKLSDIQREKKATQNELETVTEQYETLRETALSMLEQSTPQKDENAMSLSKSKKLKGILKNPLKQIALKSIENAP